MPIVLDIVLDTLESCVEIVCMAEGKYKIHILLRILC